MKKCMNCGAEIPEEVSFCPYCTATQGEKQQVAPRWSSRRRLWLAGGILAVLLVLTLGIWLWQSRSTDVEPAAAEQSLEAAETPVSPQDNTQPEDNTPAEAVPEEALSAEDAPPEALSVEEIPAEVIYQDADGEYQVFLCFELGAVSEPQPTRQMTIPEGASGQIPVYLVVYKDQSRGRDEFLEKVSNITVETIPEGDFRAVELSEPYINYDMPAATQLCDVSFDSTCGTNRILWTLEMKDGQVLHLCQTFSVTIPKTMDIYPEDEPMNNAQELQALLDRLDLIAGYDTIVSIFLPPVTYEGDIQLSSHAVNLIGATDDDGNLLTTIQGSVRVSTQRPDLMRFIDLRIAGAGSGTGLSVSAGTVLEHCTLTGWEIGAVANHGGYISAHFSTFDGNGVGLKFKTGNFGHCDTGFVQNDFTNNGTAVLIEELAGDVELLFDQSRFSGNGVDMDNPAEHPVILPAAIQE